MGTDKKHLQREVKEAVQRIADHEFLRIIAKDDVDEFRAIKGKELWQYRLLELEKKYRAEE